MMTPDLWLSLGLGGGLGAVYGLASMATYRRALNRGDHGFLKIFLGGMIARMMLVLLLVALVIIFLPVQDLPFVGSFLAVFLAGLIIEMITLFRRS